MSDPVRPHRRQPIRLPCPWDSPGKNTGVGCHFLLQCMKVKSESEVTQSVQLLATPWTAAHQAPPSMGFSRQEYCSGVPVPSPHKFPESTLTDQFLVPVTTLVCMQLPLLFHSHPPTLTTYLLIIIYLSSISNSVLLSWFHF